MQQLLYESDPYIVLWYAVRPEAWRTDRFTGWRQVPPETGVPLYNYTRLSYMDLRRHQGRSRGSHLPRAVRCGGIVAVGGVIWRRKRPRPIETE